MWRAYIPVITPKAVEIAWAAGILDGEGHFGVHRGHTRMNRFMVQIRVRMTHKETIQRLQSILGGAVGGPYQDSRHATWLPIWTWTAGNRAHQAYVVRLLRPHLVTRRKQAGHVLRFIHWRQQQSVGTGRGSLVVPAWVCHV